MRALLLTQGSRGDVQPFAALGYALARSSHEVVLGAPKGMEFLADPYGVKFLEFDDPYARLLAHEQTRKALERDGYGAHGLALIIQRTLRNKKIMQAISDEIVAKTPSDVDLIVHHVELPGHEIAEMLGIPSVPVCLHPSYIPTSAFPNPRFPFAFAPRFNKYSYAWTRFVMGIQGGNTRRWRRKKLGTDMRWGHRNVLRKPDRSPATVLQAFSSQILPASLDYPDEVHTTGFWFLPSETEWSPPQELVNFVGDGEDVVYIGFGSISGPDPLRTGKIVRQAVKDVGVRAVVATGWGGIAFDRDDPDILPIVHAPHDWLFSKVSAVVHHGGAGTFASALAAGRPQVVCPFTDDQPFNARRAHAIGVAAEPQPQRTLNAKSLGAAIRLVINSDRIAASAWELGSRIRAEDGVAAAVEILQSEASSLQI